MTSGEIMQRVIAVKQLTEGQAMFYMISDDCVTIGRDGCQPSGTICLRVGPDHVSECDLLAIEMVCEQIQDQAEAAR